MKCVVLLLLLLTACQRHMPDTEGVDSAHLVETAPPGDSSPPDTGAAGVGDVDPYACMLSVLESAEPGGSAPDDADDGGQHNCRFWAIIAPAVPPSVVHAHLVDMPDAIKQLGKSNDDGWGLGYYAADGAAADDAAVVVRRGALPAFEDTFFNDAATEAAIQSPRVLVSHVRACSSGLCDIPDPHPFQRETTGKTWLMGHNGTMPKDMLTALIDPDYLAANPPVNGQEESEWIDSELYFILMLQHIAANDGDVVTALQAVLAAIYAAGETTHGLNFFLTDGDTLWAYKDGYSLYYFHDTSVGTCAGVASAHPTESQGYWVGMDDYTLLALHPDRDMEVWDLTPPEDTADTGPAPAPRRQRQGGGQGQGQGGHP